MSVDVRSDLIQGTDTCRECPAPITRPATGRRVFCAACIVRRRAQGERDRRAAWTPERREAAAQYQREHRTAQTPKRREAAAQYNRAWRAARTPEQIAAQALAKREYGLQREYGISAATWATIFAAQGGRCAICLLDAPTGKGWCVDHDHETGAVRGILCSGCNTALGYFKDDPALMRAGATYVESHARRTS